MNKALNIQDLVNECKIREEEVRSHRTAYLRRYFTILPANLTEWGNVSVPTINEKFSMNLRESRMIVFDHVSSKFKCSALICNCLNCLNGFFENCMVDTKPVIEKTFQRLTTSSTAISKEEMLDISEDYPFDYQFLQENDNLEESKLLNDNENYVSGDQSDSNLNTSHESSLVLYNQNDVHLTVNLSKNEQREIERSDYASPGQFRAGFCYFNSEHTSIYYKFQKWAVDKNLNLNFISTLEFSQIYTLWTENGKVNLSECMHMLSQSFDFTKNYVMLAFYTNSTMKTKNTFKLLDGPEGHFVSVFLDLLTAQAKIIDSIDAVVYAEHELQSYISELYLFFMDQKQLTANSVLSFKKVYIQSK